MTLLILITTALAGGVGAAVGCLIAQHLIGSWREYRQERATRELEGHAVIRALRGGR